MIAGAGYYEHVVGCSTGWLEWYRILREKGGLARSGEVV